MLGSLIEHCESAGGILSERLSLTREPLLFSGCMGCSYVNTQHFIKPCFGNEFAIARRGVWNTFFNSDNLSVAVNLVDDWRTGLTAGHEQNPSQH